MSGPLISDSGVVSWEYVAVMAAHRHMAESAMQGELSHKFRLHEDPRKLQRCVRKLRNELADSEDLLMSDDGGAPNLDLVRDRLERSFRSPTLDYGGPEARLNKLVSEDIVVDWERVRCSAISSKSLACDGTLS